MKNNTLFLWLFFSCSVQISCICDDRNTLQLEGSTDGDDVVINMNHPKGWIPTIPGTSKVSLYKGKLNRDSLKFWDNINQKLERGRNGFKKNLKDADFSDVEYFNFKMKGNGLHNAVKIVLEDNNGLMRIFGPFWTDNKHWAQFEFMPKMATWKGAKDNEFNSKKIASIQIIQHDKIGLPSATAPVYIKDIALMMNSKAHGGMQAKNIDDNGNVIVNGSKFFPIGIYSTIGVDKKSSNILLSKSSKTYSDQYILELMGKIRAAGFNCIQSYTVPFYCKMDVDEKESRIRAHEKLLMLADKMDLKVLLNIRYITTAKIRGSKSQIQIETDRLKKELVETVNRLKGSSAILGYYIADEPFPTGVPRKQLEFFYNIIKKHDKRHPVLLVECSLPGFGMYKDATDYMAPDVYPIGSRKNPNIKEIGKNIDEIRKTVKEFSPSKSYLWNVVQINKGPSSLKNPYDNWGKGRYPSEAELRAMVYLSLVKDVKGLYCFTFNSEWSPSIPESAPRDWNNISNVMNSIRTVLPAIYSDVIFSDFRVDNDKLDTIGKMVTSDKMKYLYILTVLSSDGKTELDPIGITFSGLNISPGSFYVEVLDEDENGNFKLNMKRSIKMKKSENGTYFFSDKYANNTTHIYRIKL